MIRRSGLAVSSLLAAGALALLAALPAAATPDDPPFTDDSRATPYPGNIHDGDCEGAGLDGEKIDVEYQIHNEGKFLDIKSVPEGFELTGTVVKGGPGYNVYGPDALTDLRSPFNPGDQQAKISHWFACGVEVAPTTTATTTTTTDRPTETTTSGPGGATTTAPGGGGAGGGSDDELADTGVDPRGLLVTGSALLLIGTGLLLALRSRRGQRQT